MGLPPVTAGLFLAWIGAWAAAGVAWRRRATPATALFVAVAAVTGLGPLSLLVSLGLDLGRSAVLAAAVVVGLLLPVPWLFFSLAYTGRDELVSTKVAVAAATLPGIGLAATAVIFGSQLVPWLRIPTREAASGLVAVGVSVVGLLQWFGLFSAGGLVLVGTGALLWTFQRYEHLASGTGTLLGVFGTVPWLSLVLGLQVATVAPLALHRTVAFGFLAGGGAAVGALVGYRPFRAVPAAGNVGPATVIEELDDAVVVADREGRIVELNAAAERATATTTAEAVGADVAAVVGSTPDELRDEDTVDLRSEAGRTVYEPTVSELTDQQGRRLGDAVVLRDVTDRTARRQRLEVFNRVLRHNLRNDMTVVLNHAEYVDRHLDDPELAESTAAIVDASEELVHLSEEVRNVEALVGDSRPTRGEVVLAGVVEEACERVAEERPGVTVRRDVPADLVVEGSDDLLRVALAELVENAVVHHDREDPTVTVRATHDPGRDYPVTVSVMDDGPGIPPEEALVISEGEETPLRHTSGLGLWTVRWATTYLGGEIDIEERDPRGTAVALGLPGGRTEETAGNGE